jgi:hypothetical protein
MFDPVVGRFVVFFVARSHDDLSWYLSIGPEILKQAANDRQSGIREGVRGKDGTRLSLV